MRARCGLAAEHDYSYRFVALSKFVLNLNYSLLHKIDQCSIASDT